MTMERVDTETFSSMEICRRCKLSYRILDYWVRVGAVAPSIKVAGGSGRPRGWSAKDVEILCALGRVWWDLHALGLQMDTDLVSVLWRELNENGTAMIALDTVMIGVSCDGVA